MQDVGCGAGFDGFVVAYQVALIGRVIGIDMTPKMISAVRHHAVGDGYPNVSSCLAEIEALPLAEALVDGIIANGVIHRSADKRAILREA